MKFVKVDSKPHKNGCKNQEFIQEFLDSDLSICKVVYNEKEYCTPYSCRGALNVSINRMGLSDNLSVYTINGCVYMEKNL